MPSTGSESPDDNFFNNLSQQAPGSESANGQGTQHDEATKVKRIACVLCRKRKLKCDGTRPTCSTCRRLSHDCTYDEVRKKSGPKRGYVKLLEQRLHQVETLLKSQDATAGLNKDAPGQNSASTHIESATPLANPNATPNIAGIPRVRVGGSTLPASSSFQNTRRIGNDAGQEFSWEMIGLGLEEALPPREVMEDLYQIYFSKIHLSLPIIHRPRFLAALNLAPHMRPPVCLRYIMWTLAASVTDRYDGLQEHFYHRARKYAQMDEMRGHGESTITIAHCQCWVLTCTYEFKQMFFPRAWISAGRAVRLAQMMQLHRLDGAIIDVKQCLAPPKDWIEREERRRAFWMTFCVDRYASIGTGWPMTIDERDILTNLPASDEAYEKGTPMQTSTLEQILKPNGASDVQVFGAIVLAAAMFGRNLVHLHQPGPDENEADINGGFWTRHRQIDQILLQTSLSLPEHLRLSTNLASPNVVFANLCLHTSAICLHQAAIFKADKFRLPSSVSNESKIRCVTAAAETASIMRMIGHMDLGSMSPYTAFCVYVAARVFVQYLKTRPNDRQMLSSLQFLLHAMQVMRRKNPLTESFLVQLDLDIESSGILRGPQGSSTAEAGRVKESGQFLNDGFGNGVLDAGRHFADCGPSIQMQETQSPIANTYGNDSPSGLPFQLRNNSVDFNAQSAAYLPQHSRNTDMNSTGRDIFTAAGFPFRREHEMDISGDDKNAGSQSQGGSTSQPSYSPGQQHELHLPYRASPRSSNAGLVPDSASMFPGFTASEAMTGNPFATTSDVATNAFNDDFLMSNEWNDEALQTGSGLTPLADASWDAMLENVTMGWDSVGPTHELLASGPMPRSRLS